MQVIPRERQESDRPQDIADELRNRGFDPSVSRAIVFAMSRKKTEEIAAALDEHARAADGWKGKIHFFHAGMSAEDRALVYQRYQSGETTILCATKAFGMGMDLPNIHYVFHHQPPFSLEDYMQEIGRAGRNEAARVEAQIDPHNPVPCILYSDPSDFQKLKDRQKSSRLSWDQLSLIQEAIHEYATRLGYTEPAADKALPIPVDLLSRHPSFRDEWRPASIQRMGCHWLERLQRIRQEFYVPAHLEFANQDPGTERATTKEMRALCALIDRVRAQTSEGDERLLLNTGALYNALEINTSADLFHYLRIAQEAGHLYLYRELLVRCTKQRVELIRNALKGADRMPPHLVLALHLVESIASALRSDRFFQINPAWFTDEVENTTDQVLSPAQWTWFETEEEKAKLVHSVIKDLKRSTRARAILFLVRQGPQVQYRREVNEGGEVYLLRLDSARSNARSKARRYVERQRVLIKALLKIIYRQEEKSKPIELMETLNELGVDTSQKIEELEQALLFLRRMGYIRMDGRLLPMAIETYIRSKDVIDVTDHQGEDYAVYQDFQQAGQLKELRLAALQVLSTKQERADQNEFIRDYMSSRSGDDVFSLLEQTLSTSEAHQDLLSSLREDALEEEKERLSEDQREVYNAPLNKSTLVSAGPGSGKTHTLLIRLARLIHEESISPSQILVLAYNRAVVTEIKTRLRTLFGRLGYRNLSRSLKVFTFHGLIRYALRDMVQTDDLHGEGDPWVETFNRIVKDRPGRIAMQLAPASIRYIFVDEFQDITEERYEMLRWIAGDSSRVTAIGDPDQSIYGYERARAGQERASEPFFERFASDYDAQRYSIKDNFRSLPDIIEAAEAFIRLNGSRHKREALVPRRSIPEAWGDGVEYVEVHAHARQQWVGKVEQLLLGKDTKGRGPREVAVLFRSNAEVYRAYRLVHERLNKVLREHSIPVVIQGATQNWPQVREVAFCLDQIQRCVDEQGDDYRFSTEARVWEDVIVPEKTGFPPAWDEHTLDIIRCLVERYEKEQTDDFDLSVLAEYVRESLRRDKGQIYKLLQLHWESQSESRPPRLVIANLHKVKGLEYDAVVMPASFQPLPFPAPDRRTSDHEITDMIEEERRVYYVGMTRARDRLIRYEWRREEALQRGQLFDQQGNAATRIGLAVDADAFSGRVQLSKCARDSFIRRTLGFQGGKEYLWYIGTQVTCGDSVVLKKRGRSWFLTHGRRALAVLSGAMSGDLERYLRQRGAREAQMFAGLTVSAVTRYTYEDSQRYDEENGTDYSKAWSPYFRQKGYTYIVNFAGYAEIAEPS